MYGSVFRMQPKAGREQDIVRIMEEFDRERRPSVKGALAGLTFKLDGGGMMGVAGKLPRQRRKPRAGRLLQPLARAAGIRSRVERRRDHRKLGLDSLEHP